MSFFAKIIRALGFGPDANMADDPLYADTASEEQSAEPQAAGKQGLSDDTVVKPVEFDMAMQDAIFAKVVEVFNQSLPSFLSESVDPEAQRAYLRKSLDEGISGYLKSLNKAAEDYCEAQWKARQASMAAELEAIRLRAEDVEKKSNDIRQKQLSADRQKRALTDKVHEQEAQLAKIVSDREQLELENRSLLNKLKVTNVVQEDIDRANQEIQSLRAELQNLRENPDLVSKEREDALKKQIDEITEGNATLKEQLRVGDEIRDELRRRLKDSEAALAERDKKIAEFNELIVEFSVAAERMEAVESQIKDYQDRIKLQKEAIDDRDEEIASLKETIAENIKRQAEREQLLRNEIESLRPPMIMSGKEIDFDEDPDSEAVPRISEEDLTEMAASFESEDWESFVSVVSEEESEYTVEKEAEKSDKNDMAALAATVAETKEPVKRKNEKVRTESVKKKQKPEQLSLF